MTEQEKTQVWRVAKLAHDNGVSYREIANELDCTPALVQEKVIRLGEQHG